MTIVELESLLSIRPDRLISFAERIGKTAVVNEESEGYFKITITPDLSAGQKSALQTQLDKVGKGTVT